MPFRFYCSNCQQRLSVSSRKRGEEVKCPRCRRVIRVPDLESAAQSAEQGGSDRTEESESFPEVSPHELLYADSASDDEPSAARDRRLVMIPRYVLYTQGFLLGAVALVFFVFGLIVGSRSHPEAESAGRANPAVVTGTVTYHDQDDDAIADTGSVVLLIPATRRPDEKAPATGLSPMDPEPEENHPALGMLRSLGGDYARVDRQGHYQVRAPSQGRYYLVVISKQTRRSQNDYPGAKELAQLGRYFLPATEILGQQHYEWKELLLRSDEQIDVTF